MMHCRLASFLLACLMLVSVVAGSQEQLVSVDGVRVGRTEGRSRVVLDLSGPITYRVSQLESPPRYIVEFDDAEYALQPSTRLFDKTPIVSVRAERPGRIIFDLVAGNLQIKSFPLKPFQGLGYRLVLDFYTSESKAAIPVPSVTQAQNAQPSREQSSDGVSDQGKYLPLPSAAPNTTGEDEVDLPVLADDLSGNETESMGDFSGTWEQEWAVNNSGNSQKFEAVVEPRWDAQIGDALDFTAIVRVRGDAIGHLGPDAGQPNNYSAINGPIANNKYAELSLRELYFDYNLGGFYWRLGKQQVVWGQSDGIKVLDVVNPQSFREFILDDFDDSRIPLWMVNLGHPIGDSSSLQILWIPDTSYNEFAEIGSPYTITSPRLVPVIPPYLIAGVERVDHPDNIFSDSDAGFRLNSFVAGWDVSVNYLYHYQDTPVIYQQMEAGDRVSLHPEYERNHLLGGTLSNAFGALTLRGEVAYNSNTFLLSNDLSQEGIVDSPELSSVLGLDWQASSDTVISAQWFYSYLLDYERSVVRDEAEQLASLLLLSDFDNASWQLRVLALYSINDEDSLVQVKLKYWISSDLEMWVGADIFDGNQRGLFGQFDDEDRFLLGLKYGF
jgi:hypothetical protein